MRKMFFIHFLAGILTFIGGAAAAVSFVLYLVKARPFEWLSLWVLGAGFVLAIVNILFAFMRLPRSF